MCSSPAQRIRHAILLTLVLLSAAGQVFAAAADPADRLDAEIATADDTAAATTRPRGNLQRTGGDVVSAGSGGPQDLLSVTQIVKVVVALVITVAAILVLSAFAKKARWGQSTQGHHLQVVDSLAVGARDRIMLVAVDDERIVVAASPGQMRALHTYKSSDARAFEQTLNESFDLVKEAATP